MKIILISDLHINENDTVDTLPWVQHFCDYVKKNTSNSKVLLVIMGDVITKGNPKNLASAELIFNYINKKFSNLNFEVAFIPGNHDYIDASLEKYNSFCQRYSKLNAQCEKAWNYSYTNFNLIFTDSIKENNHNQPGNLNIDEISACIDSSKINILFLHHSILFEDDENHTGIVHQGEAMSFLIENKINYIFHGHTHATRYYQYFGSLNICGIGPIGDINSTYETNEQEQFLEITLNTSKIETISNYSYRSGSKNYLYNILYPKSRNDFSDESKITSIPHVKPENYIHRTVIPRDVVMKNDYNPYFGREYTISLFEACEKNDKILLVADAGLGKTIEMKNVAHCATMSNDMRPLFIDLKFYCNENIQDLIIKYAPTYATLDPNRLFLIFDGFDELESPTTFMKELQLCINKNPKLKVCISMRSNFLNSTFSLFSEFKMYQLQTLSVEQIKNVLSNNKIHSEKFLEECYQNSLNELVSNPFYLLQLIELYNKTNNIPSNMLELMEQIVNTQKNTDLIKFKYKPKNDTINSNTKTQSILTRLAFSMQLMNINHIETTHLNELFSKEELELIESNGLIAKEHLLYGFSHNIFKEYYVAKYLMNLKSKDIIRLISVNGSNNLNPSWLNVLGFVLKNNRDKELENWLDKTDVLLLAKLERTTVSNKLRNKVFDDILNRIIEKNIWFDSDTCKISQFALFCQSEKTLDKILNHIKNPSHFRSLIFVLESIEYFTDLYGKDDIIRNELFNCFKRNNLRSDEKKHAIRAIAKLKLDDSEISNYIKNNFNSFKSNVRVGIYDYILITEQSDFFINELIIGTKLQFNNEDEISNFSEHYRLEKCLYSITSAETIDSLIKNYTTEEIKSMHHQEDTALTSCFIKASALYNAGQHFLYKTVYEYALNILYSCERNHLKDVLKFFSSTNTIEKAFEGFIRDDAKSKSFLILQIIEQDIGLVDLHCKLYLEGKIPDYNTFEFCAKQWQYNEKIFKKYVDSIYNKTGKTIIAEPKRLSYADRQDKDIKVFFDCLFNKSEMNKLLVSLINFYENEDITIKQIAENRKRRAEHPFGTEYLETTLLRSKFKKLKAKNFIKNINWNDYVVISLYNILSHYKTNETFYIRDEQKSKIHEIYQRLETQFSLKDAYKEKSYTESSYPYTLLYYMCFKNELNFISTKEYYYGLLYLPYIIIHGIASVEEKFDLIEDKIGKIETKKHIELIMKEETRKGILKDLFYGCTIYNINSFKKIAANYILNNEIKLYDCYTAIDYLLKVAGNEYVLKDKIITNLSEDKFVFIANKLNQTLDDRLIEETIKRYKTTKNIALIKLLIMLNSPYGFKIFIKLSKKIGKPVDYDLHENISEAISHCSNVELLPSLIKTTTLLFSENFKDYNFRSLYNSLYNAFLSCSKNNYKKTKKAISKLEKENQNIIEVIGFCNNVQEAIDATYNNSRTKIYSIKEVKKEIKSHKIFDHK